MRGKKAKQLRKAAYELALKDHVPSEWAYKRLKSLYKSDPMNRKAFNG